MRNSGGRVNPRLVLRRRNKAEAKGRSEDETEEQREFIRKECFHQFVS